MDTSKDREICYPHMLAPTKADSGGVKFEGSFGEKGTPADKLLVIALSHDNKIKRITSRELEKYKNHYFSSGHPILGFRTARRQRREKDHLEWIRHTNKNLIVVDVRDDLVFFTNTGNIFAIPGNEFRSNLKRNVPYICDQVLPLKPQEYIVEIIGLATESDFSRTPEVGPYEFLMLGSALGKLGSIDINLLRDRMRRKKGDIASLTRKTDWLNRIDMSWEGGDELVSVQPYPTCPNHDYYYGFCQDYVFCRVTVQGKFEWDYLSQDIDAIPREYGWVLPRRIGPLPDGDRLLTVAVGSKDMPLSFAISTGGGGPTDAIEHTPCQVKSPQGGGPCWGSLIKSRRSGNETLISASIHDWGQLRPISDPHWYVFSDLGQPLKSLSKQGSEKGAEI